MQTHDPDTDHACDITHEALAALLAGDLPTVGEAVTHLANAHHGDGVADIAFLVLLNICAESVRTRGASYLRPDDMDVPAPYVNAVAAAVDGRWNEAGEHLGFILTAKPGSVADGLSHLLSLTRRCMKDQGTGMRHA